MRTVNARTTGSRVGICGIPICLFLTEYEVQERYVEDMTDEAVVCYHLHSFEPTLPTSNPIDSHHELTFDVVCLEWIALTMD